MIKKNIVILYHKNCDDGFGGAWAAWKKFKDKAEYIAVEHQVPPSADLINKEIYLIDFCYKPQVMQRLLSANKKIIVLDHHISAVEEGAIKISTGHIFRNDHSGAVIAWNYFHPAKKIPKLLKYIEDYDLWKFKVKNTREIFAAVELYRNGFLTFNKIAKDLENPAKHKKYIETGKIVLAYQERLVEEISRQAEGANLLGKKALAVNSSILQSEIGATLCQKAPMAIIWSHTSGRIRVSMRSNGKVDVSKIARQFGGGGHKSSAGFSVPPEMPLPWNKNKKK